LNSKNNFFTEVASDKCRVQSKSVRSKQWITEATLVPGRWFKVIGPAPVAERKLPNCLLSPMVTDRFIAGTATSPKGTTTAGRITGTKEFKNTLK